MKPTILLIDSNKSHFLELKAFMVANYDLVHATSGFEGLSQISEVKPDLVLLAQVLDDMDGFELCRRIRNDLGKTHLHVITLLASNGREAEILALNNFANDVLTDISDRQMLMAKVKAGIFSVEARQQLLFDAERLILTRDYLEHAMLEAEYFYRRYQRPAACCVIRLRIEPRTVNFQISRWMDPLRDLLCELRRADKIARLDERSFAVLMPETPLEAALIVARRLWQNLEDQGISAGDYQFGLSDLESHQFNLLRAVEYYAQSCGSKDSFGICVNSNMLAPLVN
jgi:PleD family two-component response regulator